MERILIERTSLEVEIPSIAGDPQTRTFRLEEMTGEQLKRYMALEVAQVQTSIVPLVKRHIEEGCSQEEALQKASDELAAGADELICFILQHPTDDHPAPKHGDPWLEGLSKRQRQRLVQTMDNLNGMDELVGNFQKAVEAVSPILSAEDGQSAATTSDQPGGKTPDTGSGRATRCARSCGFTACSRSASGKPRSSGCSATGPIASGTRWRFPTSGSVTRGCSTTRLPSSSAAGRKA